MQGIGTFFQTLTTLLPPWLSIPLAVIAGLWLLRGMVFRTRARQIRGLVRRMVRASPAERERLYQVALGRAGTHPLLLADLAREAHTRLQTDVWLRTASLLERTPEGRAELQRVRRLQGLVTEVPTAAEEALRTRHLLHSGLPEVALARVQEALLRYPNDADLRALLAEITAEEAGSGARIG